MSIRTRIRIGIRQDIAVQTGFNCGSWAQATRYGTADLYHNMCLWMRLIHCIEHNRSSFLYGWTTAWKANNSHIWTSCHHLNIQFDSFHQFSSCISHHLYDLWKATDGSCRIISVAYGKNISKCVGCRGTSFKPQNEVFSQTIESILVSRSWVLVISFWIHKCCSAFYKFCSNIEGFVYVLSSYSCRMIKMTFVHSLIKIFAPLAFWFTSPQYNNLTHASMYKYAIAIHSANTCWFSH